MSSVSPILKFNVAGLGGGSNMRVLVVDDDVNVRTMLEYALSKHGYIVDLAQNGREALLSIDVKKPDVMLLDLMMPDINGWEVLSKLKANKLTEKIAIVVISAHLKANSANLIECGARVCLPKPFQINNLLDTLYTLQEGSCN
jgi:DNA-binding response OmpR family regulator